MNNEPIRAIAVDDEKHCLKTLEFELNRSCPDVQLIRKIQDSDEAYEALKTEEFDLLFLDIHLQATSGIELLERLMPVDFDVIFVTAYDEYAIKAFDLSAMHYLLKPVNRNKLRSAVDKVIEKRKKLDLGQYEQMLNTLREDLSQSKKVGIPVHDGIEFIDPTMLLYVKADSNYSTFHFVDGRKLLVSKTLKIIEESYLFSGFIRIHKSHLVNVSELRKYIKNDGGYVVLSNGERLSVSRNKRQVLNDLF